MLCAWVCAIDGRPGRDPRVLILSWLRTRRGVWNMHDNSFAAMIIHRGKGNIGCVRAQRREHGIKYKTWM